MILLLVGIAISSEMCPVQRDIHSKLIQFSYLCCWLVCFAKYVLLVFIKTPEVWRF